MIKNPAEPAAEPVKRPMSEKDVKNAAATASLFGGTVKSRIYIYLLRFPGSTVDEIAAGTGIYPSTVREEIYEMYEKDHQVDRVKMDRDGLGKKPYLYTAIKPSVVLKPIKEKIVSALNLLMDYEEGAKK